MYSGVLLLSISQWTIFSHVREAEASGVITSRGFLRLWMFTSLRQWSVSASACVWTRFFFFFSSTLIYLVPEPDSSVFHRQPREASNFPIKTSRVLALINFHLTTDLLTALQCFMWMQLFELFCNPYKFLITLCIFLFLFFSTCPHGSVTNLPDRTSH